MRPSAARIVGRLSFADSDAEAAFRREFNEAALSQARLAGALAILLYAAFGALDFAVVDEHVGGLLILRAIVVLYIAGVLVVSYRATPAFVNRVQQPVICSVVVLAAYGLDAMPLIAPVPSAYSSTGSLLVLMFLFGFARIRFAPALITTIFLVVGYEVSEAVQDVSFTTVLSNNFFLLGFIVAGATTCYALESLRRREYRYEEALRGAFGTYVSHELIDRVTSGRADIEGEDVDVTILFADIRDFTWFADHATARETVAYLNEFYALVLPVVRRHGGHANKLLGDGLLAVFGAPTPLPDHADAALRAAREMLDAVWMRFDGELRVGIGINSGAVVAGTIGDPTKLDYTLIGDAVNVASRIEQLTKSTGDPILLTEDTRARLSSAWPIHSRGHHTVRGKVRPLHVYALDVPAPPRANADAARQSSTHH